MLETNRERKKGRKSMESKKHNNLPLPLPLPKELILEILVRLPVKSIVRLKCVSKSWHSFIFDPNFANWHFDLAAAVPFHRLVYIPWCGSETRSIDVDASLHDDSSAPKLNLPASCIMGSCRGFILLDNHYQNFILWNPSTAVHKTLPYPPIATAVRTTLESLPFASKIARYLRDPIRVYGFGYDTSTDDYLVVTVSVDDSKDDTVTNLEIFSVRTNSWNEIEGARFPYENIVVRSGLFFNRTIHWLAKRGADSSVGVIVAFDLIQRKFSEIIPPDGLVNPRFGYPMVLGGCLGLCYEDDNNTEIWVMKKYKVQSSWTKSFVVSTCGFPFTYFSPICFTKGGNIIGLGRNIVGLSGVTKLVKHNDKGEHLESRSYCDDRYRCGFSPVTYATAMYTESLLSIPSDSGQARQHDQQ